MNKFTAPVLGALCAALLSTPAAAETYFDRADAPYAGILGNYVLTDSKRPADDGNGYQLFFGVPLPYEHYGVEISFFDNSIERTLDGQDDYQTGLVVDVIRDFGVYDWGEGSNFPRFKPFALLGLAAVQEDILSDKELHLGLDLGVGSLIELPWWGLALRLEARYLAQNNDDSAPGEDFLGDVRIGLGVQIPLDCLFDRPVRMDKDDPDCELAVVDPDTGRKDCVADSDRDGVPDTLDRCPGTPLATQVDPYGCALAVADADGDGVVDSADQCPDTRAGIRVNAKGCAVSQSLTLRRVTFENDSAKLTAEGRSTLDGVAETLAGQDNILVEISGHTDNVGAEAYNLVLSQRRAEACRNYLVSKGVDASRLTAVGYGEYNPVAGNDSADGRAKNRRVEFHLVVE